MPRSLPRLVLTGPESTGKTVLATTLADLIDGVRVEEYLRHYFLKINKEGKKLGLADALPVAQGQWQWEEEAAITARRQKKPLICDTDLVSSLVYNRHYYADQKDSSLWQEWQDWAGRHLAMLRQPPHAPRLYLLCDIDWPWVDDGQRDAPHLRQTFLEAFRAELEAQGLPSLMLTGNLEERLGTVRSSLALEAE